MRRAALVAALAAGCGLPDTEHFGRIPEVVAPGHLRYCNSGEPEGLDPATVGSTTALRAVHTLFDGLVRHDARGQPVPSLARGWEADAAQRRFTFHLHDRGRWSNGRPITAEDVRYQAIRVLHPSTASPNAGLLADLVHARLYTGNAVRLVLADTGPLRAGDVVEVLAVAGRRLADWRAARRRWPDSNERRASRRLALRDRGGEPTTAYAEVPAGEPVQVIEVSEVPPGPAAWTYVHWSRGEGRYGWVRWAELDRAPHAEVPYRVRRLPAEPGREVEATVRAADLLMLPEVLGLRVPDARTIVFETTHPTPWFLHIASSRALRPTPRDAVSRRPRRWTDVGRIITSGPLHLAAWRPRDRMVLVRSPTYWNPAEVKLDRLTLYAVDDQAAAANLYFTGACDALAANHLPASHVRALLGRYRDVRVEPGLGVSFLVVQTERVPDRHLRRALALAIDRRALTDLLGNGQIPTAQYTPGTPAARLSEAERALCGVEPGAPGVATILAAGALCYLPPPGLDHDPARARAELALAGRPPPRLVLKLNLGSEQHKLIAEYLQHQWRQVLGLTIELEVQEWKTYLADTRAGAFELARVGWLGAFPDPDGEFLPLFRCDSPDNLARYCNPAFEAALEAARAARDPRRRLAEVRRAEQLLLEDAAVIPIYGYSQIHLHKPYVRDLPVHPTDQPPLFEAWLDPHWRSRAE
jgi:ABC-type oligopeptide transport system substrate-binding subunit